MISRINFNYCDCFTMNVVYNCAMINLTVLSSSAIKAICCHRWFSRRHFRNLCVILWSHSKRISQPDLLTHKACHFNEWISCYDENYWLYILTLHLVCLFFLRIIQNLSPMRIGRHFKFTVGVFWTTFLYSRRDQEQTANFRKFRS